METPDDVTFMARTDGVDATYLGSPVLRPFSWITSPEAISEFGDRWRDEATNVELSSGTGPYIPTFYDPDIGVDMVRNEDYWKMGADGQPLPYMDGIGIATWTIRQWLKRRIAQWRDRCWRLPAFELASGIDRRRFP